MSRTDDAMQASSEHHTSNWRRVRLDVRRICTAPVTVSQGSVTPGPVRPVVVNLRGLFRLSCFSYFTCALLLSRGPLVFIQLCLAMSSPSPFSSSWSSLSISLSGSLFQMFLGRPLPLWTVSPDRSYLSTIMRHRSALSTQLFDCCCCCWMAAALSLSLLLSNDCNYDCGRLVASLVTAAITDCFPRLPPRLQD